MLVLIICSQCFDLEHNISDPSKLQTGIRVFITQTGLSKYCNENAKVAIGKIQSNLLLPDINFNIFGFDISLKNGKFTELILGEIQFSLDDDRATLIIGDITITLILELQIVQKTFPYLQDSGSATLSIVKLQLQANINEYFTDEECPNNYTLTISKSKIQVNTFTIKIDSDLQIILNSISSLFIEVLKDMLNGELGQTLAETIAGELIKLLTTIQELSRISFFENICTDQRYFKGLIIKKNFLIVDSTGQRCILNNEDSTCFGWYYSDVKTPPIYYSNNDVQYQIEKTAFNSGFKLYLDLPESSKTSKF